MMKNAFYFISKALFIVKIYKFLSGLFVHVEKTALLERLAYFKIDDVTFELTNNMHIAHYHTK